MRWRRLTGKEPFHETRVRSLGLVECEGLWRFVLNQVLPVPRPTTWKFVMVQFWGDTGRVIVFPGASASAALMDAGCQLVAADLRARWNHRIGEDLPEREYVKQATRDLDDAAGLLVRALRAVLAKDRTVASRLARRTLRVSFYDADDHKAFLAAKCELLKQAA